MNTEALKISLTQKILGISDTNLLERLKLFIESENIVGYDAKGNPIYEREYIKEMDKINKEIDNGTAVLYTTDEVRKRIIDGHNLV
jgi:hypothetical protein